MMGKNNRSFFCFLLILSITKFCYASKNLSKKDQDFLVKYSLPSGKIKEILDKAFSKTKDPIEAFKDPDFTIIKNSHNRIVATHNEADFIIKTRNINENRFLHFLWPNTNIRRVEIANQLREYLKKNNLEKYIAIPQKWLYKLPNAEENLNDYNYIVIAEKLPIIRVKFNKFTQQEQSIIYGLIQKFGLFDPNKGNISLLPDGRLAFVDTEPPRRISEIIPLWKKFPLAKFLYIKDNAKRGVRRFFKEVNDAIKADS